MAIVNDTGLEVLRKAADVVDASTYRLRTTGTAQFTGLSTGGLITEVQLNATTWTAVPTTPLVGRNVISIQNESAINVKINYSSDVAEYKGMTIFANGGERNYDVAAGIILYLKSASGTPTVTIEELA